MKQTDDQQQWTAQALAVDRDDLLMLLSMRFAPVPAQVEETIRNMNDLYTLERLIIVAANVPSLEGFIQELYSGTESFRIVGTQFDPLSKDRGESHGES